jgi:hypothetical protein
MSKVPSLIGSTRLRLRLKVLLVKPKISRPRVGREDGNSQGLLMLDKNGANLARWSEALVAHAEARHGELTSIC